MRRLTAILNPQADRGRAGRLAERLRDSLAGRAELQLLQTTRRGEAVDLARAAGESGTDGILAIGGDGTVHEVANGLLAIAADRRPPLGVIPAGSGNDFAYAIGMVRDLKRLTALFELGETRAVDAALVETASGRQRYSINNVGTLLEGQINLASQELKWPRGSGLYLRAVARTLRQRPPLANLHLRCDGREFTRQTAMLSITNGCRSGGRFYLIPDAKIDDGRFDYLIAPPASRLRLVWESFKSLNRRRRRDAWAELGEFVELTVRSDIPLAVHVDGEPWLRPEEGERQLAISVRPGILNVFATARPGAAVLAGD